MTRGSVLVVGAAKGLGLALVEHYLRHDWRVTATSVEVSSGLDRLTAAYPDRVEIKPLDICDRAAVQALHQEMTGQDLDVLHIVAGVFQSSFAPIWELPDEEVLRVLNTNAIAAVRLAELFKSQVRRGGVFAFTSSGMGSMTRNDQGDVDLYRISKASLNMLVRSFAARQSADGRAVLLLCPGWAKTDMGGPDAEIEVEDSVAGMYALVAAADPSEAGATFFEHTGDRVAW